MSNSYEQFLTNRREVLNRELHGIDTALRLMNEFRQSIVTHNTKMEKTKAGLKYTSKKLKSGTATQVYEDAAVQLLKQTHAPITVTQVQEFIRDTTGRKVTTGAINSGLKRSAKLRVAQRNGTRVTWTLFQPDTHHTAPMQTA